MKSSARSALNPGRSVKLEDKVPMTEALLYWSYNTTRGSFGYGGMSDGERMGPLAIGCIWFASAGAAAVEGLNPSLLLVAGASLRFAGLFRCASANGIMHTARSRSTYDALRIKCALMVWFFCFFILCSLFESLCFPFPIL